MNDLHSRTCVPCRTGGTMVDEKTIDLYRQQIPNWSISKVDGVQRLTRSYRLKHLNRRLNSVIVWGKLPNVNSIIRYW